ncbi:MAG: glycosyltransferase family 2 protein [Desulfotalea sp.]
MNHQSISIIIPTYNRETYLIRALESVRKQTCSFCEVIIVDDGSTDDSANVIKKYSEKNHLPIKYYHQNNMGPAAARNTGILNASGDYLVFLDSDDHWHKNKLKIQYSALQNNPDYRISHTYEKWLRRGKHLNQKKIHIPREGDIFSHCLQLCAVGMSTVMVHKSIFDDYGLFDEKFPCCEDYDLWLRISCREKFHLVPERLTIKEGGREDQVSWQYRVGMDALRIDSIANLINSKVLSKEQDEMARFELIRKANIYSTGALKHGQIELGHKYFDLAQEYGSISDL